MNKDSAVSRLEKLGSIFKICELRQPIIWLCPVNEKIVGLILGLYQPLQDALNQNYCLTV